MPSVPFPLTGLTQDDFKAQVYELIRNIYEETIGGANLGDVFAIVGDILTLVIDPSTPGLTKSGNKLAVLIVSDGGLALHSDGVYIKCQDAGGLETTSTGIGIVLDPASNPSLALSADGLKINPVGAYAQMDVANTGDFLLGDSAALYFGDPSTNGSWRMLRLDVNFHLQRRESGNWVTKDVWTP